MGSSSSMSHFLNWIRYGFQVGRMMMDPDPKVQRYAEAYLRRLALHVFKGNTAAYQAWYREFGGKPVDEA